MDRKFFKAFPDKFFVPESEMEFEEYLAQLQESDRPIFEQELLEQIKQTYPVQKNGTILFRFPRLFWIARKGN